MGPGQSSCEVWRPGLHHYVAQTFLPYFPVPTKLGRRVHKNGEGTRRTREKGARRRLRFESPKSNLETAKTPLLPCSTGKIVARFVLRFPVLDLAACLER